MTLQAGTAVDRPTLSAAVDLLRTTGFLALTGAGMSTDSGIPDYRGPGSTSRTPMTYQEFCSGPAAQQRYWARAHLGWTRMGHAAPNGGHHALARLEYDGHCTGVVTQNVDGLHEAAGSRRLVALHGRIADVVCLGCREQVPRTALQREMDRLNPGWRERHAAAEVRPDGDVALDATAGFVVPRCPCGGALKPDVVFFGELVPAARTREAEQVVDAAEALLVVGSSLAVNSGLRLVSRAHRRGSPIVVINRGATKGDRRADVKIDAGATETLEALAAALV